MTPEEQIEFDLELKKEKEENEAALKALDIIGKELDNEMEAMVQKVLALEESDSFERRVELKEELISAFKESGLSEMAFLAHLKGMSNQKAEEEAKLALKKIEAELEAEKAESESAKEEVQKESFDPNQMYEVVKRFRAKVPASNGTKEIKVLEIGDIISGDLFEEDYFTAGCVKPVEQILGEK